MNRYAYLLEGRKSEAKEDETISSGFIDATDAVEADEILDGMAADVSGYESVGYTFDLVEELTK